MHRRLSFALFSPDGIFGQSDTCVQVSLPGKSGEFVFMPNAMPCIVVLRRGFVVAENVDGGKRKYYTSGGLCQISEKGKRVSVFAEEVIDACSEQAMRDCMEKIKSQPITLSDSAMVFVQKLH